MRQTEDISPCVGCPNAEAGIIDCRKKCERLEAYRFDRPYKRLSAPPPTIGLLLPEKSSERSPELSEQAKDIGAHLANLAKIQTGLQKKEVVGQKPQGKSHSVCVFQPCNSSSEKLVRGACPAHYKQWRDGFIVHPELGEFSLVRPQKNAVHRRKAHHKTEEVKMEEIKAVGSPIVNNTAWFDIVVNDRCNKIKATLEAKAKEYAAKDDRFHNFNMGAAIDNTTPEKALKGMMLKHEVSVRDLIAWAEESPERITENLVDQKIGDNINYLILLEGLLLQRIKNR